MTDREARLTKAPYDHKMVWGKDRRAQGPIELRRNKITKTVKWRYNGSEWSAGDIPAEIADLFEETRHAD